MKTIFYEGNLTPWVAPWIYPKKLGLIQVTFNMVNIILGLLTSVFSDKIIVNSGLIKNGMEQYGLSVNRVEIIRGGADTDYYKPFASAFTCNYRINVGFIGRLEDEKGVSLLLDICKKALNVLPTTDFFIFGDGSFKIFFECLPNVKHLGKVNKSTLEEQLRKIQIVLFFQKDLGLAEYEAMAAGKALICCDLGDVSKVLKNYENALLCKTNPDSYIFAISQLIQNPVLLNKLQVNARETVVKYYDWKVISSSWGLLIKTLLADLT